MVNEAARGRVRARRYFRGSVVLVVVALVAAACSGGNNGGHDRASSIGSVHARAPLASEAGARYAGQLVVGTSFGTDHVLRGVGAVFPPSVTQLTAGLVVVGPPAGSNATVTWSEEFPAGERTLFTQQVALRPRGVVHASASGSGHVARGVYRVHVTVASEARDALFVIGPSRAVATPVTGGRGRSRAAQTSDGEASPDDQLTPGDSGMDDWTDPCEDHTPEGIRRCTDWLTSHPADNPNVSTTTTPCPTDVTPELSAEQEAYLLGGYVDISAHFPRSCHDTGGLSLAASVGGAAPTDLAHGDGALHWSGNTCTLAGRSDLFGDIVHARATADSSKRVASQDATLIEDGPLVTPLNASPPEGTKVDSGKRIEFAAAAVVLGATRGIKSLVVNGPDGTELARAGKKEPAAECEQTLERYFAYVTVSYRVPSAPPPIIEMTLSAETFDGAHSQYPLRWSTKPTWSGVLNFTVDQQLPTGHQHEEYKADVVVSETDANKLEGRMRGEWTQTLTIVTCPAETITPGSVDAPLTGTFDSTGMHLTAGAGTSTPPEQTPCFGQQPGLMGNPLVYPELAQLLDKLAPKGNGRFAASLDVTKPTGGYPYTVRVNLQLDAGARVTGESPFVKISLGS